jgi:hypothetical protein
VLAALDGFHRGESMVVVRCRDHDSIDFLHLVQHPAVVGERLRVGITLESVGRVTLVHVAQRNDVLAFQVPQVAGALAADANAGEVQFPARRHRAAQAQHRAGHDHERGGGCRAAAEELTTGEGRKRGLRFRFHTREGPATLPGARGGRNSVMSRCHQRRAISNLSRSAGPLQPRPGSVAGRSAP